MLRDLYSWSSAVVLALAFGGAASWVEAAPPASRPTAALSPTSQPTARLSPTAEATAFLQETERQLLRLWIEAARTGFVHDTYITDDTQMLFSQAQEALMAFLAKKSKEALRYRGLPLSKTDLRKFELLRLSAELPAPASPALQKELATIATSLGGIYGKGKYCKTDKAKGPVCSDLMQLSDILSTSRSYDELLDAWKGWRTISPPMRSKYQRYVEIANQGAREMGFADVGAMWRSRYDMTPDAFSAEIERLWSQVQPLYQDLHCYVRSRLVAFYGADKVPPKGPIPAHLLGNMWAQSWEAIYPLVAPKDLGPSLDTDSFLKKKALTPKAMTQIAERFFTSLGMPSLPPTFWSRSLFEKPRDRDVVCHASAWHIDYDQDIRLKQCIKIDTEDLVTLHHELGHLYYYLAYRKQDPLFRSGAHDGFHEGIGDAISLAMTPTYYQRIAVLPATIQAPAAIPLLLKMALERVAFLPFGKLIDQWRWGVFQGSIPPSRYNAAWWHLRTKYQGVASPIPRSEADFDPGAKYHIPANVPYSRYFLAAILQFQFFRALCQISKHQGPLHTCSFFGHKEAGQRLWAMLSAGQSQPWPAILSLLTGQTQMDASAILDYFAPLHRWLRQQNKNTSCGW